MTTPLLDPAGIDRFRTALAPFTVDGVHEFLDLPGEAALRRGDLAGVGRRALAGGGRLGTLIRLFLLGEEVDEGSARMSLAPLELAEAQRGGLVEVSAGGVRARLDVRPYAEAGPGASGPWWVVSDFGSDVRPGPLAADHVLGIGSAALTLAQATIQDPVSSALDIGTGCGVQALHLGGHARTVTATDISPRALSLAATTAALSGVHWDLRQGSFLEPVAGEQFDRIVANPPFVVSPGRTSAFGGYDYRDSGLSGDAANRKLVEGLPDVLSPGATAQLLANWMITSEEPWDDRVAGWVRGRGCDAWIWQREAAEPAEYVTLWLRDAGELPGTDRYQVRYDEWLDWFEQTGTLAVGMGLITLWHTGRDDPIVVCEDVRQVLDQPIGRWLPAWHARQAWLADRSDAILLGSALRAADGVVRTRHDVLTSAGWQAELATLRQTGGMRWEVETDDAIAAVLAGCDGSTPLGTLLALLAATSGDATEDIATAALPVVRDLVGRGFLEPVQP
jgi:methylase of polypeptide subunit release factors